MRKTSKRMFRALLFTLLVLSMLLSMSVPAFAQKAVAADKLVQCDNVGTVTSHMAITGVNLPVVFDNNPDYTPISVDAGIFSGGASVKELTGLTSSNLQISLGAVTNYDYDTVYEIKYRGHYIVMGEGTEITEEWKSTDLYFKVEAEPDTISIAAIVGVTAPVRGATPVTSITGTDQYTGTVSWTPNDSTFAASTAYTATITLTPKAGYTLTGVAKDFFTVSEAISVSNDINSGVITAVFPKTAVSPVTHTVSVSANPAAGGYVTGGDTYNENASVTVTATANSGYTFVNWTEGGSSVSTDAAYTFLLGTTNRILVANFIVTPPVITTGTITGTVTDGTNSVSGAAISLMVSGNVYYATTAANGSYSIPNVPAGTGYTVTASKTGYTNGSATNVSVTANTMTSGVNITLTSDEDSCLVTYKGAQARHNDGTNTYDIRFIATINTLNAKEVGFVFSKIQAVPTRENASMKATSTVYTEITALGSPITAASLGGQYIIACTVTGITAEDINVGLYVRAFSTVGTVTKYTPVTTVTVADLIN